MYSHLLLKIKTPPIPYQTSLFTTISDTLTNSSPRNVKLNDTCIVQWTITIDKVISFAELTGDKNPIHLDPQAASKTIFKKPIAHGLLCASLFPSIVSKCFP